MSFITPLFFLLFLHILADFPFQGEYIANAKNRSKPLPDTPWWFIMGVHSYIHSAMVLIVTGVWWMALAEFIIHFITDDAKCCGRIGYLTDQGIHLGCKIIWAALLAVFYL